MKAVRILKTFVCVILACVVFAGVLSGVSLIAANRVFSDPDALARSVADESYDEQICVSVRDEIDRAMLLLSVDENLFDDNVSDEDINEASHAMLTAVMRRVLLNDRSALPGFENAELYDAIEADITQFAAEHDLEVEDGAAEEVYEYLCGRVTSKIRVAGEDYINKIPDLGRARELLSMWYLPLGAALLCAAAIFAVRRRKWLRALTAVTIPVYAAAFIGFVLSRILQEKDYLSKVSLDQSALREFLIRVYRVTVDSFVRCFGTALAVSLVLLAADLVLYALSRPAGKKRIPAVEGADEGVKTAENTPENGEKPAENGENAPVSEEKPADGADNVSGNGEKTSENGDKASEKNDNPDDGEEGSRDGE